MKLFPLLTFAWLLYLAVNGKLVEFVTLANKTPLTPPVENSRGGPLPTASTPVIKPLGGFTPGSSGAGS